MRPLAQPAPANDIRPPVRSLRRRASGRAWLSTSLFAGASIALFVILAASVVGATVLYYRWH